MQVPGMKTEELKDRNLENELSLNCMDAQAGSNLVCQ